MEMREAVTTRSVMTFIVYRGAKTSTFTWFSFVIVSGGSRSGASRGQAPTLEERVSSLRDTIVR